jgi:ASCH domain
MIGLRVKQPWIDLILRGVKTWELRGSRTKASGRIALIQSGTAPLAAV